MSEPAQPRQPATINPFQRRIALREVGRGAERSPLARLFPADVAETLAAATPGGAAELASLSPARWRISCARRDIRDPSSRSRSVASRA